MHRLALALLLVVPALAQTPGSYIDPAFGEGGFAVYSGGDHDSFLGPVLDADGGFYFAGCTTNAAYTEAVSRVLRFTADGALDPAFGEGGVVTLDLNADSDYYEECFRALHRRPDGRLLGVATAVFGPGLDGGRTVFVQLLPDGTLDPDFGEGGVRVLEYETRLTYNYGSHLAADGALTALVLFDLSTTGTGDEQAAIVRLTPEGDLDAAFGEGGIGLVPGTHRLGRFAVLPDGGFQFVDMDADTDDPVIRRFSTALEPDPTWGTGGVVAVPGAHLLYDHVWLADGSMVFAVSFWSPEDPRWDGGAVRLRPDGTPDAGFGSGADRPIGRRKIRATDAQIDHVQSPRPHAGYFLELLGEPVFADVIEAVSKLELRHWGISPRVYSPK